MDRHNCWG